MPIITITRGSLSITFKLKDKLSEVLGCRSVSREEVLKHAEQFGIQETGLAEVALVETKPPHFWDRHAARRRHYLAMVKAALMDFAVDGDMIYHGHLGQFLLYDVPKLLRVRADASVEFRVGLLMRERGFTEPDAHDHIKEIDARRRNWARFLYGADFDDQANYDIILNMDKMSIATMADIVAHATELPEFKLDDASRKVLKDIHLKSRVLVQLVQSPRTCGMDLSVECDAASGSVKVVGIAPTVGAAVWEQDIKEVLSAVDGITHLEVVSSV